MHPITFQYANMYKGCIKCRECRTQGCRGCRTQRCRWCRAQGAESTENAGEQRVQGTGVQRLKGTDNTRDAGSTGVLGAGLRGSRIPESAGVHRAQGKGDAGLRVQGCRTHECREVRECTVQGCRECRGAEGTRVQGSGMLEV